MVDAGRREAHLRVLNDVEEVGRAQVFVAGRIPGVEAVGVDRELDRRAAGAELVRAVEPVEAAVNGDQAPERLDGELDRLFRRGRCSSGSAQPLSPHS